jgi:hypothetical protein
MAHRCLLQRAAHGGGKAPQHAIAKGLLAVDGDDGEVAEESPEVTAL